MEYYIELFCKIFFYAASVFFLLFLLFIAKMKKKITEIEIGFAWVVFISAYIFSAIITFS